MVKDANLTLKLMKSDVGDHQINQGSFRISFIHHY